MTETDDTDKKEIKTEDGSDDVAAGQAANLSESEPIQLQAQDLITNQECLQNVTQSPNGSDVMPSASLPTAVITTQRRMITTTGQIR